MLDKRYKIVFSGKLSEGSKPPEVLHKLCAVLRLEDAQVRALFKSGAGAIILNDLDGSMAEAFLEKLLATGVICRVEEVEATHDEHIPFSGTRSVSQDARSVSQGNQSVSQGTQSVSQGTQPVSQGTQSVSQGTQSVSQGTQSVSQGTQSVSQGTQSVSQGHQSVSQDNQSVSRPRPEQRQRHQNLKPAWQPPIMPQQESSGIFGLIIKIILVAAVVGGGWWAYQTWFAPPTPAFTAYASFAEAIARGQYQKAADESLGDGKAYAESWIQMTKPSTMKIYGKEFSTSPPSVASIAGDIAWIKRKRKSEVKKSDTHVELQVEQTVCRIPPGVSSAICKWPVTFEHDVELEMTDGTWKVSGFKEIRLTPQDK